MFRRYPPAAAKPHCIILEIDDATFHAMGGVREYRTMLAGSLELIAPVHPKVVVEEFPAYDPHDNPAEFGWSWAKYGKMCNLCPADVNHLFDAVWDALEELKDQPGLLASFVTEAGVPLCL